MNKDLLIKSIEQLQIFYNQKPEHFIHLTEDQYRNLSKGGKYLIAQCPVTFDFTKYLEGSSIIEIANQKRFFKNRDELIQELDLILEIEESPKAMSYKQVSNFIELYLMLLRINPVLKLNDEKCIELSGYMKFL